MQAVALSSSPTEPAVDLQPFERLAATVSSRFARMHIDEIGPALAGALEQLARAVDVDASALVEFAENGSVSATHTWPDGGTAFGPMGSPGGPPQWLVDRLARHELVAVSHAGDLPVEERARAWRAGGWSGLAVPVLVAEQLVC